MNLLKVYSPRIHNLGDFANCLPTLSGLYKTTGLKMSFGICDRLQRFNGIKELLLQQEMFAEVHFMHEKPTVSQYIVIDDTGSDDNHGVNPYATQRYTNFVIDNYKIQFETDSNFELIVPKLDIDYQEDKFIIGDRWSPKDAPDVDDRRYSNMIESLGLVPKNKSFYLDYTKDLIYNCSMVRYNPNLFITTFTGIGILADLMKKDLCVLWGEDVRNWAGKPVENSFETHYYFNRKAKLVYVNDFNMETI